MNVEYDNGIFMYFPTKQILIIFDEVLLFMKDPKMNRYAYSALLRVC